MKELEKYGFERKEQYQRVIYTKTVKYGTYDDICYIIGEDTKIVEINTFDGYDEPLDTTIYDLIKDGLV